MMAARPVPSAIKIDSTTVRLVAEANPNVGMIHDDVANAVAVDAELAVRVIIEQARSFMHHARRDKMSASDIAAVLRMRGDRYSARGYISRDPRQPAEFVAVTDVPGLFVSKDSVKPLTNLIHAAPLPSSPLPQLSSQWLSFDGRAIHQKEFPLDVSFVQDLPCVPSKYLTESGKSSTGVSNYKRPRSATRQLDSYYQYVTSVLTRYPSRKSAMELEPMLESLSSSTVIQPLLPAILSQYHRIVAENITLKGSTLRLIAACRALRAVIHNPRFGIESHVHNALPPLLTCVIGRFLGDGDHLSLRHIAADVLRDIFEMFGTPVLRTRVVKTIVSVLTADSSELAAVYGAVVGLTALGPDVVRTTLLPFLPTILSNLENLEQLIVTAERDISLPNDLIETEQKAPTAYFAKTYLAQVHQEASNVASALIQACRLHAEQVHTQPSLIEDCIV